MITAETRAHLMAARDDIYRPGDGHPNLNLTLVADYIDRALRGLCPHLPSTWKTRTGEYGGLLTTCYACGMSWYDHEADPPQIPYDVAHQNAFYMASLRKRLETRRVARGFAYVIPREAERLEAAGLYQPGHTVYRFSTESEDRSDAALEQLEIEAERACERLIE